MQLQVYRTLNQLPHVAPNWQLAGMQCEAPVQAQPCHALAV
jgi:hypothetical protein